MHPRTPTEVTQPSWRTRDSLAAAILFLASAAFVLWQNSRVAVLWDLDYLLDSSWRIALGQIPYRDFPFAHAPGTFLIQAALIKVFGRHYIVPVIYAAFTSGAGSVLAWRIVLRTLHCAADRRFVWPASLLLAAPLAVLGINAIYPHPIYDCDCALFILVALLLLMRLDAAAPQSGIKTRAIVAGAASILPIFFKQNMGLPFAACVAAAMAALIVAQSANKISRRPSLVTPHVFVLIGMALALCASLTVIAATAGLANYFHWTVTFAAQRRLPALGSLLADYAEPSLAWTLPATIAGLLLCITSAVRRPWVRIAAIALIAAPLARPLVYLFIADDADDRASNLLALWPLWLVVSLLVAFLALRRGLSLRTLMPFIMLAAIHATFLSQQLWGSTYALWPLLIILIAQVLSRVSRPAWPVAIAVSAAAGVSFAVCGGLYAESFDRLSYIDIPDAPLEHAAAPALHGMATPGPYLANLDQLIQFSDREIPREDALILLPGEDPFYFATGRAPQFPVTLFDPATDPYSPQELIAEARLRNVQWVIVKRVLQSKENDLPQANETMRLFAEQYAIYRRLAGYDVYRRR